jgi:hypothetical protein
MARSKLLKRGSGIHFMRNSLFDMADNIGLLPVIRLPRDFQHWIFMGLFGYHIKKAIIYCYPRPLLQLLISAAYFSQHGSRKTLVSQSRT